MKSDLERDADGDVVSDVANDTESGTKSDEALSKLLASARNVAVVGIKNDPNEDAFRIPEYMQQAGYHILPINPKFESILNEPCHDDISQVDGRIDIVNLFRASEHIPAHVDEIAELESPPKVVWMQLGIHHGPSARRLRDLGIAVVQDRCIMVDHRRLLGR